MGIPNRCIRRDNEDHVCNCDCTGYEAEIKRLKADLIAANEQIVKDAQDYTRVRAENEKLRAQRDRNWGMLSPENKKKLADAARTEAALGD